MTVLPQSRCSMGPFSISGIAHTQEQRERYTAQIWCIEINFPEGHITFESPGLE
jgi:hypothetical protein